MANQLAELREVLGEVADLQQAANVLLWDMETYLPPRGIEGRGQVLATLGRRAHDLFASDRVATLLDAAESRVAGLDFDSDDASLVRVTRRDHERERRIPSELVGEMAVATAAAGPVWREARSKADFSIFAPYLRTNLELARRKAEAIGFESRPYDALLYTEPGMTIGLLETVFGRLREAIVPLVRRIAERAGEVDDSFLASKYPEDLQHAFARRLLESNGYDFERGRIDPTAHPFMIGFNHGDVRITNRSSVDFLPMSLFGALHEGGHGIYGQGHGPELDRTPLWDGASPGFHESQSRLYENLIGRSRPFWKHWFPELRRVFPEQLGGVDAEGFYRAVNKVHPSLIRVEADEVTYNLHIMLRVELENELLEGRLEVDRIPDAWNARMEEYLGIEPPTQADGALQDIHWTFAGEMGIFPAYTLGNLIGAQLMERIRADLPELDAQVEAGEMAPLLGWLGEKVHRHGRKYTPAELLRRITGAELDPEPWISHVRAKFGEIYRLD